MNILVSKINLNWKKLLFYNIIFFLLLHLLSNSNVILEYKLMLVLSFIILLFYTFREDIYVVLVFIYIFIIFDIIFLKTIQLKEGSLFYILVFILFLFIITYLNDRYLKLTINQITKENELKNNQLNKLQSNFNAISNLSGVSIIERDVDELFESLQKLKKKGITDLENYLENNYDVVMSLAMDIKIVSINKQGVLMLEGENEEEIIRYLQSEEHYRKYINHKDFVRTLSQYYNNVSPGIRQSYVYSVKGKKIPIIKQSQIPSKNNTLFTTLSISIEKITEIKERLTETESRMSILFNEAPIGMVITQEGIIVRTNKAYLKIIGSDIDVSGKPIFDFVDESEHDRIYDNLKYRETKGKIENKVLKSTAIKKDGNRIPVEVQISDVIIDNQLYTLSFIKDISLQIEKEKMQLHMIESHRLESLGLLAGGLTHDFNNILTGILGGLELLTMQNNMSDESIELIEDLLIAVKQATSLTNSLLNYTGKSKSIASPTKIINFITELRGLIKLSIPSYISVNYVYDLNDNTKIFVNQDQFNQVIINLMINAADAISDSNSTITLIIDRITIEKDTNSLRITKPNFEIDYKLEYARFKVIDTGKGIQTDDIHKIFDPFFTNKKNGQGLGLSVVQGIVFQYDGIIEVSSEIDKGSEITVYIPITQLTERPNKIDEIKIYDNKLSGLILIIEDELTIRKMLSKMLKKIGFEVLEAENGKIGLEIFSKQKDDISLVILDLSMPVLSGRETFTEIIKIKADIPVLISSGFSMVDIHEFDYYPYLEFLEKPYRFKEFKDIIFSLLQLN